jgi:hypothetical protein
MFLWYRIPQQEKGDTMKFATLILVFLALAMVGCSNDSGTEGRVVFGITDAAADMGTVSSVQITIESIELRGENDAWVTVSEEEQTFDLLQLKAEGATQVLADVNVSNGTYSEIRLDISKVVIVDENGEQEAKLPSNELKLKGDVTVEGETTSVATFDFLADQSLHVTGNGKYVLAPVVKVTTTEKADVEVDARNNLQVKGGTVRTDVTLGMGADGNVAVGVQIPANAAIEIDGGVIKAGTKLGIGAGSDDESDAEMDAKGDVKVEI